MPHHVREDDEGAVYHDIDTRSFFQVVRKPNVSLSTSEPIITPAVEVLIEAILEDLASLMPRSPEVQQTKTNYFPILLMP